MKIKVKVKGIIYLFVKDRKAALSQGRRCFSSLLFSAAAAVCSQRVGVFLLFILLSILYYSALLCSALLCFALLYEIRQNCLTGDFIY
jgi:hypothetical protein